MAIGIVLSVFGLGFFCWLLFTLAVYALPFLAGLRQAWLPFIVARASSAHWSSASSSACTVLVLGQIVLPPSAHR